MTPAGRLLAVALLCLLLAGLGIWAGTLSPDPDANRFPGNSEVAEESHSLLGDRVTVAGVVVATDPLVIDVFDEPIELTISTTADSENPAVGDDVWAHGTLTTAETVEADRVIVRASWEVWYMYLVSLLAGLWVLGRFLRHWQFDPAELVFRPRQ